MSPSAVASGIRSVFFVRLTHYYPNIYLHRTLDKNYNACTCGPNYRKLFCKLQRLGMDLTFF
jgi:hypothetical protein